MIEIFLQMRVLWFETSQPARYLGGHKQLVVRGWQDALEEIIRQHPEIELFVAFESEVDDEMRSVDGVTYIPVRTCYSFFEKRRQRFSVFQDVLVHKLFLFFAVKRVDEIGRAHV